MASEYLTSGELAAYGLPTSVTTAQIQQASMTVDAMQKAPKGLVWAPDAAGKPCYMTGAIASMSFTTVGAITSGSDVTVVFDKAPPPALLGRPIVLDRSNADAVEAAVITALDGVNVTLDKVAFGHDNGVTAEAGLQHQFRGQTAGRTERVYVAAAPVTSIFVPRMPIGGLVSGRYRFAARSWGLADSYFLPVGDTIAVDLVKPGWTVLNLVNVEMVEGTGQVFLPLDLKTEVDLHYVSGWQQSALPTSIKMACARLIALAMGEGAGNPEVLKDVQKAFNKRRFGI